MEEIPLTTMDREDERLLPDSLRSSSSSSSSSRRNSLRHNGSLRHQYVAALLILLVELAERMTYYGIICNQVLLATSKLKYSSVEAVTINLVFTSVCYFLPVLGGLLSDIYCGYFNTLYAAGLTYIVGAACFPILTFDYQIYGYELPLDGKRALFILGLTLIPLGTGGIKSNVGPFGAEQLQNAGPNATQTYFTWFYWFINVGAMIAYGLLAYIQQEISLFIGYLIPTLVMIVAVLLLVCSKRLYRVRDPDGSVLPKIFSIIFNAYRVKRTSILHETNSLDYARRRNGGRYHDNDVDDVITLVKLMPVFLCFIIFWIVYNQMSSTFFLQGERMDIRLGSINVPAASLNLIDSMSILILAPLMDRIVYPILDKVDKRPTQLVRIGIGMLFAMFSMLIAAVLEIYRKQDIALNGSIHQVLANETFNASSLSLLYQIPQFMSMGMGEVFLCISGQEFAFAESPDSMKSAVMGLFLIMNGFGSLLGSVMINIANSISYPHDWVPNEINSGFLENYLFLLAGLMSLNLLVYILVARSYQYCSLRHLEAGFVEFSKHQNGFTSRADDSSDASEDEVHIDIVHKKR